MNIGMLWFDDSSHTLDEKIDRAVKHYSEKYGRTATLCLVNPKTLNGGEGTVAGVELRSARSIMPDHYWIGVEEEKKNGSRPRQKAA